MVAGFRLQDPVPGRMPSSLQKSNKRLISSSGLSLVYPAVQATGAGVQVVSRDHTRIVEVCRQVDVGKAYQTHLDEVLDARAASALAEDAQPATLWRCG